jgi:hypothetical protein
MMSMYLSSDWANVSTGGTNRSYRISTESIIQIPAITTIAHLSSLVITSLHADVIDTVRNNPYYDPNMGDPVARTETLVSKLKELSEPWESNPDLELSRHIPLRLLLELTGPISSSLEVFRGSKVAQEWDPVSFQ